MAKKRNQQDATLLNVRATKKRLDDHGRKINRLQSQVLSLTKRLKTLEAR